jgi:hypothetical protein
VIFAFWWTGKGYVTALIAFGALCVSGIAFQGLASELNDGPWPWSLALVVAAAINWNVGRRHNAISRAKALANAKANQFLYRARHKFMSLPMETFSFVLVAAALVGLVLAIRGSG